MTRQRRKQQSGRRVWLTLLAFLVLAALSAGELFVKGELSVDSLLVELGFKEPATISLDEIPEYSGKPYVILQDNWPDFSAEDMTTEPF